MQFCSLYSCTLKAAFTILNTIKPFLAHWPYKNRHLLRFGLYVVCQSLLYNISLDDLICSCGFNYHLYVNGSQIINFNYLVLSIYR